MAYGDENRIIKRMGGRYSDILLSFFIITLPMLAFAGLLLGLVFRYRVTHNSPPYEHLLLEGARDEPGIYYVNLNATFIVFIASWSSSVAPMLASFILVLAAYPICRQYLAQARANVTRELLTPYQLALTLRFMNGGGFGALWSWLKYHVGWKNVRERQGSVLKATALISILSLSLGIAVFLADTWLHVTTKTVNFVQISPVTTHADYSLTLIPECTLGNNSFASQGEHPCSINAAATAVFLANATQSFQVLNNISDVTAVLTYEGKTSYAYLGIPEAQFAQRDFTASTFGMNTQCRPVSNECNLNGDFGAFTPFTCADSFQGDLTSGPSWQTAYFSDPSMSSNESIGGVHNPFYFGLAARENAGAGTTSPITRGNVSEIVSVLHGGIAFVLFCTATLYDVEYDTVNGTITRFVTSASNNSVANAWQGPISVVSGAPGTPNLQQAAGLAVFSNTAQELADKIALAYSQVALAVGAQAVRRSPALAAQERQSFLVARIPAAPLFTLVIANLLFVMLGVILTAIALCTSGGEVREVQARLSIVGLVADRFEAQRGRDGVEDMDAYFEEKDGNDSMRVAIDHENGEGYVYKTWPKGS